MATQTAEVGASPTVKVVASATVVVVKASPSATGGPGGGTIPQVTPAVASATMEQSSPTATKEGTGNVPPDGQGLSLFYYGVGGGMGVLVVLGVWWLIKRNRRQGKDMG